MDHYQQVKAFFDRTATRYRERPRAFRQYYFGRRIEMALAEIQPGDAVLDVGCGRGELYDRLLTAQGAEPKYFGLDISPVMLQLSKIPPEKYAVADLESYTRKKENTGSQDKLVALGLTTYYLAADLPVFYAAIAQQLTPGGKAIISYTHATSWDYKARHLLNRIFGPVLPGERSLGRGFSVYATTPEQVMQGLPAELSVECTQWLPAAMPLFTHWFPHLSVRLTKGWFKNCNPRWSADFVLVVKKL